MKKPIESRMAQSSEFIGIAILVVAIVLISIITRMQAAGSMASRAESILKGFRIAGVSTTAAAIPYSTISGIPLEELLGVYSCYGKETADYGAFKVNITNATRNIFDSIYGKNSWALILKEEGIDSYPLFLSSDEKSKSGEPGFSPYLSYDFRFPKPCKEGFKGAGILFAVSG
ncbi:MAG: hypothetical protein NTV63_05925 [Candidatus Woesearchaeota archaeon]|nr:hypothetical protein [Candidatus Woesearchaeota archaeon]